MKNNKGFTLIELLAIIVLLAIISIIAIPNILNLIENSKEGALKIVARNIIDAGKRLYSEKSIDTNNPEIDLNDIKVNDEYQNNFTLDFSNLNNISIKLFKEGTCVKGTKNNLEVIHNIQRTDCLK